MHLTYSLKALGSQPDFKRPHMRNQVFIQIPARKSWALPGCPLARRTAAQGKNPSRTRPVLYGWIPWLPCRNHASPLWAWPRFSVRR